MMLDLRGPHTGLAIDSGANSAFCCGRRFPANTPRILPFRIYLTLFIALMALEQ